MLLVAHCLYIIGKFLSSGINRGLIMIHRVVVDAGVIHKELVCMLEMSIAIGFHLVSAFVLFHISLT